MEILNIPAPVRMTPCPTRLQLQTLWIGVTLTGKMTFWGDKCLTKVDHAMKIGVLNIPAPIRMTPCPPRFYLTNKIIQNRQTTKPVIVIQLKSLTFKWRQTCCSFLIISNHIESFSWAPHKNFAVPVLYQKQPLNLNEKFSSELVSWKWRNNA